MKVNQIKKIMDIKDSERMYFYNLLRNNLKKSLSLYIPSFSDNENIENISLYSLYPLLFRKEFNLTCEKLDELILFSHNLFSSLFILDKMYDSQVIHEPVDLLVLVQQYSMSMSYLDSIGIKYNPFILENISKTMFGLYKEKYVYKYNEILSIEDETNYAFDKYSFAKLALFVYQTSSNNYLDNELFKNICLSHDYFAYGRQILDDMEDFEIDYANKMFNIYVNRFFYKYGNKNSPKFDYSIFSELLSEAKNYFEKALDVLSGNFDYWSNYINFYLKICEEYSDVY